MNAIKCTGISFQAPWFSKFSRGAPDSPVQEGCSAPAHYPIRPPLSWRNSAPATLQFPPATFFQFENPEGALDPFYQLRQVLAKWTYFKSYWKHCQWYTNQSHLNYCIVYCCHGWLENCGWNWFCGAIWYTPPPPFDINPNLLEG